MFFFTLIVALAYVYALGLMMSGGMVALGISDGGYLGAKAVDHTKT
jgi:hypothetical protein